MNTNRYYYYNQDESRPQGNTAAFPQYEQFSFTSSSQDTPPPASFTQRVHQQHQPGVPYTEGHSDTSSYGYIDNFIFEDTLQNPSTSEKRLDVDSRKNQPSFAYSSSLASRQKDRQQQAMFANPLGFHGVSDSMTPSRSQSPVMTKEPHVLPVLHSPPTSYQSGYRVINEGFPIPSPLMSTRRGLDGGDYLANLPSTQTYHNMAQSLPASSSSSMSYPYSTVNQLTSSPSLSIASSYSPRTSFSPDLNSSNLTRKERNRQAAERSRRKKKDLISTLSHENQLLRQESMELARINRLQEQKLSYLLKLLSQHQISVPSFQ